MSDVGYREKCLRQKINACAVCGDSEELYVHHINGDRSDNRLSNLIPICPSCHTKVHSHVSHGERFDRYTEKLPDSSIIQGPYTADWRNEESESSIQKATTTVQVDKHGRAVIPKQARRILGIDDKSTNLELEITVLTDD